MIIKKLFICMMIFILSFILCVPVISALELNTQIQRVQINFYDENGMLIDEYIGFPDRDDYEDEFTFSISAKTMCLDFVTATDNDIDISLNCSKADNERCFDISEMAQLDVAILIDEYDDFPISKCALSLIRNDVVRSNKIDLIEWDIKHKNGYYYPVDIIPEEELIEVKLPFSAETIEIISISPECSYADIFIYAENGDAFYANEDIIELKITDEINRYFIELTVDGEQTYYEIDFIKAMEPSNDNTLRSISFVCYDDKGIFDIPSIECVEGITEYDVSVPESTIEMTVLTYNNSISSTTTCMWKNEDYTGCGFELSDEAKVDIIVTAENNDTQTYKLNIIKESAVESIATDLNDLKDSGSRFLWVYIVVGVVVLALAIILVFIIRKKSRKTTN